MKKKTFNYLLLYQTTDWLGREAFLAVLTIIIYIQFIAHTFVIFLRSGCSFYKPVFPRAWSAKRKARCAIRCATFTLNLNNSFVFEARALKFCINDTAIVLRYVLKNHENRPTGLGTRYQNVLTLFHIHLTFIWAQLWRYN